MNEDPTPQALRTYGTIGPIEPDRMTLKLSELLRKGKDYANAPGKVWGMGAGDLLFGESPEYFEDRAYGFSKSRGKGFTYRPDSRLLDVAGLPIVGGLAAKGGSSLFSKLLRSTGEEVTDEGRRKFLKQGGALAGASVLPDPVAKALRAVAPDAAIQSGKALSSGAAAALAGAKKWFSKESGMYDNWTSEIQIGGGMGQSDFGVYQDSLDELVKMSGFESALEKAFGGAKGVDADALTRIMRWGPIDETVAAPHNSPIRKLLKEGDAKLVAQYDELLTTGKLPEGAPRELLGVDTMEGVTKHSKFHDLNQLNQKLSGKLSRRAELNELLDGAHWSASPKGQEFEEFTRSEAYNRWTRSDLTNKDRFGELERLKSEFSKTFKPRPYEEVFQEDLLKSVKSDIPIEDILEARKTWKPE